jgi:hypothetical protein
MKALSSVGHSLNSTLKTFINNGVPFPTKVRHQIFNSMESETFVKLFFSLQIFNKKDVKHFYYSVSFTDQ